MQGIFLNMNSPKREYELSLVVGLFFRDYEICHIPDGAYDGILSVIEQSDRSIEVTLEYLDLVPNRVLYNERIADADEPFFKQRVKRAVYLALSKVRTSISPWGILVGIRPVKIVHEAMDIGLEPLAIRQRLSELYRVSEEKIDLLMEVAERERPHLYPINEQKVSLYISIPFCPTRCVYCSFPSNPLSQKRKWVEPYISALIKEIQYASQVIYKSGRIIDCVYIGGGTPTSLSANELEQILIAIQENVRMDDVLEFTVEAGRPDTITTDKLEVLKQYRVDRICVNPQTMEDKTLSAIGRNHTSADIHRVMEMIQAYQFKTVNMDLIVGLEEEGVEEIKRTVDAILKWHPENVTLHTLALKRASELNRTHVRETLDYDDMVKDMMALADQKLRDSKITPYYMYRQKKMIGHLENVGYAKLGHESLYNMRIIEERHTIMALGAGATSKICFPKENRHERIANFKGVEEYIQRFDEILKKKDVF